MDLRSDINSTAGISEALTLEKEGDLKGALAMYEKLLKEDKANEKIISRLIVISHKLKKIRKKSLSI